MRSRRGLFGAIALAAALCAVILFLLQRVESEEGRSASMAKAPASSGLGVAVDRPAAAARSESSGREMVATEPAAARSLNLVLTRFPDDAPVADALLEVEPRLAAADEGWLATSSTGRAMVEVPGDTRSLRVAAEGFDPAEIALDKERELSLTLTPSSGLFGRVLRPDGSPAAATEVQALTEERSLRSPLRASRSSPRADVFVRNRAVASSSTNERGYYYLAYATRTSSASTLVRATSSDGLAGSVAVTLPRETTALEDLVLAEPETLVVHVVDEDGQPIAGATVWSYENPQPVERLTTGPQGTVSFPAPNLPASLRATAEGLWAREVRFDGKAVQGQTKVESCRTRVDFVLAPFPMSKVRFVDAETGLPIFLAHGTAELLLRGEKAGESTFELDQLGEARIPFLESVLRGAELPDLARLSLSKEGYSDDQVFEIYPSAPPPPEPPVFALEPVPGYACLRGRAVRGDEPVANLQVGLRVQLRSESASLRGGQYARAYTDGQGRFSLRWKREADQVVTAFPHWTKWEEFAYLGPMSAEEAVEREHVLELLPAIRVPAVLHGVDREGRYCYYVAVREGEVGVPSTINGAPISVQAEGSARVMLSLPSQRRSRITIGYMTESRVVADCSTAAEYDPAHPVLPLVFEVQPIFARVSGRVAGFTSEELGHLGIGLLLEGEQQAALVRPTPNGSFLLSHANRGEGELFLVQEGEGRDGSRVLARQHIVVDRDLDALVLSADPGSLPERPEPRK